MLPRPDPFIDPRVVTIVRAQKAALLQAERATMADLTGRWLAMEYRLTPLMDALAQEMVVAQAQGQTITTNWLLRNQTFKTLASQARADLYEYIGQAANTITDQMAFFGDLGLSDAAEAYANALDDYGRLPISGVPQPGPDLTDLVTGRAGLAGDGNPLLDLLGPAADDSLQGLGKKTLESARLMDTQKITRAMQDGLAKGYNRVLNTSRSESFRLYREAQRAYWQQTGRVTGYMRMATHDNRVCPGCLMDEGTIYQLAEDIPEHPQGRCGQVPVVMGQPRPTWLGGARWFEGQSESLQRDVLGPGRYDAWVAGKFSLDELAKVQPNSTWGPSIRGATLAELTNR